MCVFRIFHQKTPRIDLKIAIFISRSATNKDAVLKFRRSKVYVRHRMHKLQRVVTLLNCLLGFLYFH